MKLVNKDKGYKAIKTINFIKKNKLLFFFFNSYLNIHEWKFFKQQLITKNFNFLIAFKVQIEKIFLTSIYTNFMALKNQILILIYFRNSFLPPKTLPLLAIKLNKYVYHNEQLKNNCSYSYIVNKLILFKFTTVHLKIKSK